MENIVRFTLLGSTSWDSSGKITYESILKSLNFYSYFLPSAMFVLYFLETIFNLFCLLRAMYNAALPKSPDMNQTVFRYVIRNTTPPVIFDSCACCIQSFVDRGWWLFVIWNDADFCAISYFLTFSSHWTSSTFYATSTNTSSARRIFSNTALAQTQSKSI